MTNKTAITENNTILMYTSWKNPPENIEMLNYLIENDIVNCDDKTFITGDWEDKKEIINCPTYYIYSNNDKYNIADYNDIKGNRINTIDVINHKIVLDNDVVLKYTVRYNDYNNKTDVTYYDDNNNEWIEFRLNKYYKDNDNIKTVYNYGFYKVK